MDMDELPVSLPLAGMEPVKYTFRWHDGARYSALAKAKGLQLRELPGASLTILNMNVRKDGDRDHYSVNRAFSYMEESGESPVPFRTAGCETGQRAVIGDFFHTSGQAISHFPHDDPISFGTTALIRSLLDDQPVETADGPALLSYETDETFRNMRHLTDELVTPVNDARIAVRRLRIRRAFEIPEPHIPFTRVHTDSYPV